MKKDQRHLDPAHDELVPVPLGPAVGHLEMTAEGSVIVRLAIIPVEITATPLADGHARIALRHTQDAQPSGHTALRAPTPDGGAAALVHAGLANARYARGLSVVDHVVAFVVGGLAEGRWLPGEVLSGSREIAADCGRSQHSVWGALVRLAEWDILVRPRPRARYVVAGLPTPPRSQLERAVAGVRRPIDDGTLAPGSLLPRQRQLAAELGVSPYTVFRAWRQLSAEGLIFRRPDGRYEVRRTAPRS